MFHHFGTSLQSYFFSRDAIVPVLCHSTIKIVVKMPHASVSMLYFGMTDWTPKFVNWDVFSETGDPKVQ